ncbi:hypothetical protein P4H94_26765 [Paenibacillus macerans]|uniref:hypothetical protein n=1 Tax=Paenibacillus macerans TaxID=44252 RepID=UPI002DB68DF7|nr:hypothetical protein [Paenibacillus macerans]MEC0140449.1 hypothetical protein [Paenibacillus macerans]
MSDGLNLKEISKRIKESGKHGSIIWSRQKERHFVSNRHFLLKVEEVPSDILISLFSVFLKVPIVGETLICNLGKIEEPENIKPIDFDKIYNPEKQCVNGQVTPFLKETDKKLKMRVIHFPDCFKFINEQYMKMTTEKDAKSTTDPVAPVYFANDQLMLLPFRLISVPGDSAVLKLIGDDVE